MNRRLHAVFDREENVISATDACRERGYEIIDVHSPYPVHGLIRAMGLKPSRMPHGGAGNTNGIPASQQQKNRELEAEKAKLGQLKEKHRLGGGKQSDLAAFTAQKRVVDRLQLALNSTPK